MDTKEQAYTIFNSEGKLLQVEYGLEAVYSSYQTVTLNAGTAVICVSKKVPVPKLCVDKHTSIFQISENVYMNITGLPADIDYVVNRSRILASSLEYRIGCTLTPDVFARALADKFQVQIQRSGKRASAFAAAIFGFEAGGALLHYTDLSGIEYPCHATAAGEDFNKMIKYLDKHYVQGDINGMVELAISTLLESIGRDAEFSEIEVGVLTRDGLNFLSDQQIESVLQEIAEKQ